MHSVSHASGNMPRAPPSIVASAVTAGSRTTTSHALGERPESRICSPPRRCWIRWSRGADWSADASISLSSTKAGSGAGMTTGRGPNASSRLAPSRASGSNKRARPSPRGSRVAMRRLVRSTSAPRAIEIPASQRAPTTPAGGANEARISTSASGLKTTSSRTANACASIATPKPGPTSGLEATISATAFARRRSVALATSTVRARPLRSTHARQPVARSTVTARRLSEHRAWRYA